MSDLSRALAVMPCIAVPNRPAHYEKECTIAGESLHPECIAAFFCDPANAPLLLAIPVVHDLQQRLERTRYLLNYVETVGMDGADFLWVRIAVQEAEAALAFFTKESTDGK